jgi:predicted nucleic acid-binding protein
VAAYFFDSSAIVKRYVNETGTAWVISVTDPAAGGRVYVAAITGVEVVSAVTRRLVNVKNISQLDASAAMASFRQDFAAEYRVIAISDPVISRAMTLAELHALRGYDAVQLGAAVETNVRRQSLGAPPLIMVASDKNLLTAAVAEGLTVDDPNNH